jgi:hypothetical protein
MPVYLSFLICALAGGGCHAIVPVEGTFAGYISLSDAGDDSGAAVAGPASGLDHQAHSLLDWRPRAA